MTKKTTIIDEEDGGGGSGSGSVDNEKHGFDFDISEVDDDGGGDFDAAAAADDDDDDDDDDTMFCRRRPAKDGVNANVNVDGNNTHHHRVVEVSITILDPSNTKQQQPGEECIDGPEKKILGSVISSSPSPTAITARFHQRAQGSKRDQSEESTNLTTKTMFDLQDVEVAVGVDVGQIPPRHNHNHHSAAAAAALSLHDIALLLRRTLREVEHRIDDNQQLIEEEEEEEEESSPTSQTCFDLAKQRSLRHHENNDNSPTSNNKINVDDCRNGDSQTHTNNLTTKTRKESSSDGGVDIKNGKNKFRHIHELYENKDDSMWWRRTMMKCLRGSPRKIKPPPPFTWTETGWTFVGVSVTLLLLFGFNAIWEKIFENSFNDGTATNASHRKQMTGVVLGPFGALLTLQFGVTSAPLGQPRNILYGQVSALVIGFVIGSIEILPVWLRQTLSTVLAICFMVRYGITHPPAGAGALLVSGQKITYLSMTSTLIANIIAIGSSTVINNLSAERQYPMSWNLSWPELKDGLMNTLHSMCAVCYDMVRSIRYNQFWGKGDSEGDTEYDGDDDHHNDDGDEWSEILPPKLGKRSSFDESPTLSSSSSLLSSSSLTSSLRRTQRYSYSTLQWQSLRRANSGVVSWLSSHSLSLSSSTSSMRGGLLGTDDDMVQPSSQDNFLLDEATQITGEDGSNGSSSNSSADSSNNDGGGVYGSIGLPI